MGEAAVPEEGLLRELRFTTASTIVVGTVIGSGIFFGANRVAGGVDSVFGLFAVWIGAGLLTLLGALTYAEFAAMFPRSGGDYVYVTRSIGPLFGFLTGWASFAINLPASNAYLALAFASQIDKLKPDVHAEFLLPGFTSRFTAVAIIVLFTTINYFGVRQGGATQRFLTFGKVGLTLGLVAVALLASKSDYGNFTPFFGKSQDAGGTLAVALVAALFAYDGWNAVARVAGEVRDPQRVVPRALTTGVLAVILVYVLVNVAYLLALGLEGMTLGSPNKPLPIASAAADALLGDAGKTFVVAVVAVSILGTINGITLSGPRVYFAMARDGLFPPELAQVHPRHRTPHKAILIQGAIGAVLAIIVPIGELQAYVVIAAWVAYILTAVGLMRMRRTAPDLPRPYRVPLYPWIPLAFLVFAGAFLVYLFADAVRPLIDDGEPAALLYFVGNVLVLALGVPVYHLFRRRARAAAA